MIHHTSPIQSVLLMVFFLSIGLLIDARDIWNNLTTVLIVVAFVAVLKTALNIGFIRLLGEPWPRALLAGALLAQLGEFSFVLAALGHNVGAVTDEGYRLIVAVTVLSLLGSPFWLESARRLNRIALLGITSGREIMRLIVGRETKVLLKSRARAEDFVTTAAGRTAGWYRRLAARRKPGRGER